VRCRLALALLIVAGCGEDHSSRLSTTLEPVVAGGVPGVFVYVREGTRTETGAVGLSNVDAHTELRPDAHFRIGSVTKTFVATVVLQLAA
jgi:D-alanyl-D-alanine carboxypeptidase